MGNLAEHKSLQVVVAVMDESFHIQWHLQLVQVLPNPSCDRLSDDDGDGVDKVCVEPEQWLPSIKSRLPIIFSRHFL